MKQEIIGAKCGDKIPHFAPIIIDSNALCLYNQAITDIAIVDSSVERAKCTIKKQHFARINIETSFFYMFITSSLSSGGVYSSFLGNLFSGIPVIKYYFK